MRAIVRKQHARAAEILARPAPPLIFTMGTRNASSDGAVVRVNPVWLEGAMFNSALSPADQEIAILGMMAHELGHHYDPDRSPNRWTREKYADAVAGLVLGRAGHDERPLCQLLSVLPFSPNHPPLDERRVFMQLGRARA